MSGPVTCPHCGSPAHRVKPIGFWEKGKGYGPRGVRYVCSMLYQTPPKSCPGSDTFYGEDAEELAIAAWNRRTPDPAQIRADALRGAIWAAFIAGVGQGSDEATSYEWGTAPQQSRQQAFDDFMADWNEGSAYLRALLATTLSPTAVDGSPAPDTDMKGQDQ